MGVSELRTYLEDNLGYSKAESRKLKVVKMREIVDADRGE
jgi:hypothetical protein